MRRVNYPIKFPIWSGGKRAVGIADFRLNGADEIAVTIDYKRKDGTLSFPHTYVMSTAKLRTYPIQIVGGGVRLHVAPLVDWDIE